MMAADAAETLRTSALYLLKSERAEFEATDAQRVIENQAWLRRRNAAPLEFVALAEDECLNPLDVLREGIIKALGGGGSRHHERDDFVDLLVEPVMHGSRNARDVLANLVNADECYERVAVAIDAVRATVDPACCAVAEETLAAARGGTLVDELRKKEEAPK